MRALFLVSRDYKSPGAAGGDIQVWEWARYLASRGHKATIVCTRQPGLPEAETAEGVRILRLGGAFSLPLKAALYYLRNRKSIDVVYDDVIGGGRLPFLAPLYARKPVIASWHQANSELFAENYPRPLAKAMTLIERVVAFGYRAYPVRAPTEESRQALHRSLGLSLDRIHVVPANIPDDWFAPAPPSEGREPLIVWIGKFRPYKCPLHLVEAMPQVLKAVPGATLVLAGRHDARKYEEALAARIAALGLQDRIDVRFAISEEEKRGLLARARVLALPSRLEGFGIVVLEANASGAPVVASTGVPESAVRHEYNGLRYEFGDIGGLASALSRVLTDDTLHSRLAANGLAFVRQFTWGSVGAQFEGLAKSAMERKNGVAWKEAA